MYGPCSRKYTGRIAWDVTSNPNTTWRSDLMASQLNLDVYVSDYKPIPGDAATR